MTLRIVSTVTELQAAFLAASDGDRIELQAGDYGEVMLSGRSFDKGITITSADADDPAVLTHRLVLSGVEGVNVTGLDLLAAELSSKDTRGRFVVSDSRDVSISDMVIDGHIPTAEEGKDPLNVKHRDAVIEGYGYDWGLSITGSENVSVQDVELRDLRVALNMNNSEGVSLDGLDIHRVREGVNIDEMRDVEIANSHFHDFKPWWFGNNKIHDHSDMIQFWGTGGTIGVHDLTIRNNLFEQGADDRWTQTIFGSMRDTASPSATATNFNILDNTIINSQLNGISLYDVQGAVISGNLILPQTHMPDDPTQVKTPAIVLVNPTDIVVSGNTLLPYAGQRVMKTDDAHIESGNVIFDESNVVLRTDPDSPLFWKNYVDGRAAVTTNDGVLLLPTIDNSNSTLALSWDGSAIEIDGDGGKSIAMDVTIATDTVLSFDFMADVEGAVHGIGFAKDGQVVRDHVFQLLGNGSWGRDVYDGLYEAGRPAQHYDIPVGQYFTGDFDQIVLLMRDDRHKGADSTFANIHVGTGAAPTEPTIPGKGPDDDTPAPETQGLLSIETDDGPVLLTVSDNTPSTISVSPDGTGVSLSGKGAESAAMDITVTRDTVLSFDFSSDLAGALHGIGFARGDGVYRQHSFQLLGSRDWGRDAYDDQYRGEGEAQHYDIAVGDYFTGKFDQIVFLMDEGRQSGADSTFANIALTDAPAVSARAALPETGADETVALPDIFDFMIDDTGETTHSDMPFA